VNLTLCFCEDIHIENNTRVCRNKAEDSTDRNVGRHQDKETGDQCQEKAGENPGKSP